jgi:predicted amidohydrolase YtcJ
MNRREFVQGLAIGTGICALSPQVVFAKGPSPNDGKADWIYKGGLIYTVDPALPTAEAVAVRGDRIVFVGSAKDVEAWTGPKTRAVDLAGGMLMPGFINSHDHLASTGIMKLGVNLSGLKGKEVVFKAIRQWIAGQSPNATLRGYGWVLHDTFGEELPRREWLDEITGDRPMYLLSSDIHETWFNTAAMKKAGLSASTPDPDPGKQYYKRDPDGTPTGLAIEAAAEFPIVIACGMTSPETVRESQRLTIDRAPSWGMTTYCDCGVLVGNKTADGAWVIEDLIKRDQAGDLPLRIVATVFTRNRGDDPQAIADELVKWNKMYRSDHVSVGACKMWTDGTFIAGTAKLLEPFADGTPGGKMFFTQSEIEAQIEAVQKAGFDMHIHADGDGSVRTVLDAYESVQKRLGLQGRRHTICHMSLVSPEDMPRFKKLGLVVNGTPLWATDYNGVDYDRYMRKLGAKRFDEELLPYGDMVRSGATFTIGADLGGVDVTEIAPLLSVEAAVTRQRPGFPKDHIMVKRQRMSLEAVLKAYTINGAYQLRMEDQIGSITVGKKADLMFLQKDLFKVPTYEIHSTKVVQTMMDGKVTHSLL